MKKLFKITLTALLIAFSGSAWAQYYIWGGNTNDPLEDGSRLTVRAVAMTSAGGVYTYTIESFSSGDYVFFISSSSSSAYRTAHDNNEVTASSLSGYGLLRGTYSGQQMYHIWNSEKKAPLTITYNPSGTGSLVISDGTTQTYKITTSLTEGTISPTSYSNVEDGDSKVFTVTIPDDKQINKTATNYSGTAEISYNGNEITLSNVKSSGTLTVAFSSTADETPVVYWEQYPTIGINAVNMHGYLAERYCNTVTEAGFYWKETNDITASDISNPVTGHKIVADNLPAENGNSFHKAGADFRTLLDEPTTIYLVNYVTTSGGTGLSDVVALVYKPCFPISSVTLNSDNVKLPQDYKYTFEATARSAGKTPVYKWYLDDALIEGAASNTYEFTMPNTNPHTIKVEVTGDCEVSEEATANITSCTIPEIALTATPASTTPWAMVEIAADGAEGHIGTGLWSVTPDAELKNGNYKGVEFRAGTPGNYTIKYVGISEECNSGVQVEAEIEITVNADSEDCVKP